MFSLCSLIAMFLDGIVLFALTYFAVFFGYFSMLGALPYVADSNFF